MRESLSIDNCKAKENELCKTVKFRNRIFKICPDDIKL